MLRPLPEDNVIPWFFTTRLGSSFRSY
jgi:hypothetical protein